MTTVWVTRWAMEHGVEVALTADDVTTGKSIVVDMQSRTIQWRPRLFGQDWHTSLVAAIARAEGMRDNRIASLERRLAKLRAMTFEE